jgi:Flp pilus assembly protein TadG
VRCLSRRRSRRRSGERGAALVEFAVVFPLLFMLVAGMIDFGMVFSDLNAMRQGVREGARQAVVAEFGTNSTCPITGAPGSVSTTTLICLTKERIGLPQANTRVKVAFANTNEVGGGIIVCAMYPMSSVTGTFEPLLDDRILTSKVEMRIEKVDDTLTEAAEVALIGDWSWCA